MIKVCTSFAKKIPAEAEYSSQQFHASIEVELSDGLAAEELQERIHRAFDLVRSSVESELAGRTSDKPVSLPPRNGHNARGNGPGAPQPGDNRRGNGNGGELATNRQIKFALALATARGIGLADQIGRAHV